MIRGASTQFRFKLPYNRANLSDAKIAFWQEGDSGYVTSITKTLTDCTSDEHGTRLYVTLNGEETSRFLTDRKGWVQLLGWNTDGVSFSHKKQPFNVYPISDVLEEYIDGV